MKVANLLGFSRSIGRQAASEVMNSGGVGFLTVSESNADHFVAGGRALERIWLTATGLELCFHPMAGLPVFLAHAQAGGIQLLPKHQKLVQELLERFTRLYPQRSDRIPQIAFRIGYPAVRSRTLRRRLEDVICRPAHEPN